MSTQILNFKKMEVVGTTKDEALAKAPFTTYMKNATQAYELWKKKQTNGITEKDVKQFCLDYLAKYTKNAPGVGCYIVVDSAVADTRERPYKIEKFKNEQGTRKFKSMYKWVKADGTVVITCDTTQADAMNAVKDLYKVGDLKEDVSLVKTKEVVEGQAVLAVARYTPSKASHAGTYIAFGIEA